MADTRKSAVAYYRTSSASGVGEDKDTLPRQKEAVKKYALMHNVEIVAEFYDGNVRGTVKIEERPEFSKLLELHGRRHFDMILVETANRFSRDVLVQLIGYDLLRARDIDLIPVDAPEHFRDEDNPTAEMLRIIVAAVSMYEKKSLVKKMSDARARKREKGERAEGRIPPQKEAVELAVKLREQGLSFRIIGEELSKAGFRVIERNKATRKAEVTDRVYQAGSVRLMIENYTGGEHGTQETA